MFVDQVTIYCKGGDGGSGCMSFRREPYVPRGGPDGGDGGRGGHVIIQADTNVSSLANIVGHKHWNAARGTHGEGGNRRGRRGADAIALVPPGTLVRDGERGHILKDLSKPGDSVIVARGGSGGHGNRHFANALNQAPREFEEGHPGEERTILLELKLIADVGLVGKPNAGKSTLLSRMTRAKPEIADYPFTTLHPNLGLVRIGYDQEFVLADIPGLIEGAHEGVGLGHEFLKHVERTKVLVHLVEPQPMDGSDPLDNYRQIVEELRLYDAALAEKPVLVCVTKSELPDAATVAELFQEELHVEVMQISAVTGAGLPVLIQRIFDLLREVNEPAIS